MSSSLSEPDIRALQAEIARLERMVHRLRGKPGLVDSENSASSAPLECDLLSAQRERDADRRAMMDSIPALLAFIGLDRRYRAVSRAYEEWFGLDESELVGRHIRDVVGAEAFARVSDRLDEAYAGLTVSYEERMPYALGGHRCVSTSIAPHRDADGTIDGVIALTTDISERIRIEQERKDLSERVSATREEIEILYRLTDAMNRAQDLDSVYAAALDAVLAGLRVDRASVLLFDPDGVMRFKAWRGLSEEYRSAVEGHTPWTPDSVDPEPIFTPDVERDESLATYLPRFRAESVRSLAFFPLIGGDRVIGKFMVYDARPRHFTPGEARIAKTIGIHVAQAVIRQHAFESAHAERQRAEAAGRAKDEFLAMVSHELRTPLTAIVGWTQMLLNGAVPEDRRLKALDTIDRNAQVQVKLIEDLLDYSRINSGKLKLNVAPIDLADSVRTAIDSIQPSIEAKGLLCRVSMDRSVGVILGDADRLQQVVWNLLSNAVKFTPRGGTVSVDVYGGETEATVTVADNGVGIEPSLLPHVFGRFHQSDGIVSPTRGGLGLGLAIVRHLVEQHGGSIRAESAGIGLGATFHIQLPLVVARAPVSREPVQSSPLRESETADAASSPTIQR